MFRISIRIESNNLRYKNLNLNLDQAAVFGLGNTIFQFRLRFNEHFLEFYIILCGSITFQYVGFKTRLKLINHINSNLS